MIFTDFMKDVEAHIDSRLSGLPKHELQEMSAYIANRAIVMVNDYMHSAYRVNKNEAMRRLRQRVADIKSEEATE
jgi:hypothetical protein